MKTLRMIERIRRIMNNRVRCPVSEYDYRLSRLLRYLRFRYYRDTGVESPV